VLDPVVLERAEEDIYQLIAHGIRAFGAEAARVYAAALRNRILWLCEHPGAGPVHGQLAGSVRSFRQGSHRIYYRHDTRSLTVIRILHLRMDAGRHFA